MGTSLSLRRIFSFAAGAILATASLVSSPLAAQALEPTTSVGSLVATGDADRFTFAVTLTGFTNSKNFLVYISTSEGTLDLPETTGLTALTGYPALSGAETDFGFSGDYSDIEAALAEIGLNRSNSNSNPDISVSIAENPGGNFSYWAGGNRYYEYVEYAEGTPTEDYDTDTDGEYSWEEAAAAAETRTVFGVTGYLVTITSQAENDFVADKTDAADIWIGAGRKDIASFSESQSNPGLIWEWKTGPEAGTPFAKQKSAFVGKFTAISGRYNAWASGEPNNYQYEESESGWYENYAVTNWQETSGDWNDLPNIALGSSRVHGFLVEYGGDADFTVEQAEHDCGYASSEADVPCLAKSSSSSSGGSLAATGANESVSTLAFGALISSIAGVGVLGIVRRRQRATRSN